MTKQSTFNPVPDTPQCDHTPVPSPCAHNRHPTCSSPNPGMSSSTASAYPVPPPSYSSAPSSASKKPAAYGAVGGGDRGAGEPLLAGDGDGARDAWHEGDELDDDFKVSRHSLASRSKRDSLP